MDLLPVSTANMRFNFERLGKGTLLDDEDIKTLAALEEREMRTEPVAENGNVQGTNLHRNEQLFINPDDSWREYYEDDISYLLCFDDD